MRKASFGAADDPPAKADGAAVLSYRQAVVAVQAWAEAVKANPTATIQPRGQRRRRQARDGGPTVEDAMRAYIEAKRRLGQADRAGEADTVLHRHMAPQLRALPVQDLTPEVLNSWLAQLAGRRRVSLAPGAGCRKAGSTRYAACCAPRCTKPRPRRP